MVWRYGTLLVVLHLASLSISFGLLDWEPFAKAVSFSYFGAFICDATVKKRKPTPRGSTKAPKKPAKAIQPRQDKGKAARLANLTHFTKGQPSANPAGRPRKWVSTLVNTVGYKKHEIIDALHVIAAMTVGELEEVFENSNATILEVIVAKALWKARVQGDLHKLEIILNRALGQPKASIDIPEPITINQVDYSKLDKSALQAIIKAGSK